ncbi:MAG: HD domain-containing protein [Brevefilum sp.]
MKTMTGNSNFQKALNFISYVDQLKSVIRKNALHDGSRKENTAEHSWHGALSAFLLAPYANFPINADRVAKMLLIHDLIEIEAGDTFVYDTEELKIQEVAEAQAANEIFQRLPANQGEELKSLWEEFEARQTPEAIFAKAIDRFLPIYSNLRNDGFSWQPYGIFQTQVRDLAEIIRDGSTQLWEWVDRELTQAVKDGSLEP